MALSSVLTRHRIKLPGPVQAALFSAVVIVIGYLIALKIYQVPTRRDILIFFSLVSCIPVLKFPIFGVFYLFIVPSFIPFIRRFYYTFYDRPGQDLFHVIPDVVVILLSVVVLDRMRKGARPGTEDGALAGWVWAFIFYQFVRIFVGTYVPVMDGLNHFKFNVLYVMCFFIAVHFVTGTKQVVALFKITSVLGLLAALYGIKQVMIGYTAFEEIWLKYMRTQFVTMFIAGIPRPFSLLASPACFADLMMFAIVTSYSLSLMSKGAFRFFYLSGIPVMVYALLLTSVRTNWMGLIAGTVFWLIIAHRSSLRLKAVMIAAVLAFSFFGNMAADTFFTPKEDGQAIQAVAAPKAAPGAKGITDVFVKERLSTMASPFQEHSMISRFEIWKTIFQHSVLWLPQGPFGWGLGSYDAHSYYFSILSDTGYPGLFILLFLLFRIFMIGFKVYGEEEDDNRRVLVRGIIVILFLISFVNLTGVHVGSHPADVYYWFFAGLLLIFRRLKGDVPLTAAARRTPLNDPT